jgi:hypothetical protein
MIQKCKKCQIEKEFNLTYFPHMKVNGKIYLEKSCKSCKIAAGMARSKERWLIDPEFRKRKLAAAEKCRLKDQLERNDGWKKRIIAAKKWKLKNPDKVKLKEIGRHKKRYSDPFYRINKLMSNRINQLIKDKNNQSWISIVDYTIAELKNHLENKFRDGMTWKNYGKYWHIDHVKPVSHFKFSSKHDPEFKECWRLENLQPLLAFENLSKGNRYIG